MFALALYLNEVPVAYVRSPNVKDEDLFALDALLYSTVPKYKLRFAMLSEGFLSFSHTMGQYTLVIITDRYMIPGFYKELLWEIRAKIVPYEGQNVEETLRPYGVRLIENLESVYAYVPRRIADNIRIVHRRIVAETGHEAFGLDFGDFIAVLTRKGIILGEGKLEAIEEANINGVEIIEKTFGKKPRALILPSGPRSVWSFVLRALLSRRCFLPWNDGGRACR